MEYPTPEEIMRNEHYCPRQGCYHTMAVDDSVKLNLMLELFQRIEKLETEVALLGGDT
jgi:hypothetical protein